MVWGCEPDSSSMGWGPVSMYRHWECHISGVTHKAVCEQLTHITGAAHSIACKK